MFAKPDTNTLSEAVLIARERLYSVRILSGYKEKRERIFSLFKKIILFLLSMKTKRQIPVFFRTPSLHFFLRTIGSR